MQKLSIKEQQHAPQTSSFSFPGYVWYHANDGLRQSERT